MSVRLMRGNTLVLGGDQFGCYTISGWYTGWLAKWCGESRSGMKIHRLERAMPVQVRPPAPLLSCCILLVVGVRWSAIMREYQINSRQLGGKNVLGKNNDQ